mmetsp:Transcript_67340/g.179747  ORF Transcript_67340/g.179747 Transcript_67340/m.179747 type:complete len:641 (-) Transcript_67340:424-2346(-)
MNCDLIMRWVRRAWQMRRMVITKDQACFAFPGDDVQLDYIPLAEIELIIEMKDNVNELMDDDGVHALQLHTDKDGHNSGRSYYIQADSKEGLELIRNTFKILVKAAKRSSEHRTAFRMLQYKVKKVYVSSWFQGLVAILIAANFACTLVESEMLSQESADQTNSSVATVIDELNLAFTILFTFDLLVNAFAHWFRAFVMDPWNMLDFVVVSFSLISLALSRSSSVVRILRALRVIRIFGRVKSLRKIITAITMALIPVANVWLILFLLISIGAVIATSLFGLKDPENFSRFDRAFISLFEVTAGDPWPEALRQANEDGSTDWSSTAFIIVFTVTLHLTLLEVTVAVLLDNFIGASTKMDEEERLAAAEEIRRQQQTSNPLEPLLLKLARDFTDSDDLTDRLRDLYQKLDADRSGGLDSLEFCAAVKKLDFTPRIHMSDSDFASITNDGALCDSRGQLGPAEFETVMRLQIRHLTQSMLQLGTGERSASDTHFMQFGSIKMMMMEQTHLEQDVAALHQLLNKVYTIAAGKSAATDAAVAAAKSAAAAASEAAAAVLAVAPGTSSIPPGTRSRSRVRRFASDLSQASSTGPHENVPGVEVVRAVTDSLGGGGDRDANPPCGPETMDWMRAVVDETLARLVSG